MKSVSPVSCSFPPLVGCFSTGRIELGYQPCMGKQQTTSLRCAAGASKTVKFLEESKSSGFTSFKLATRFCDYLEATIVRAFDDYNEKKPQYWLRGNYAPVEESQPETCVPITGTIPDCMNGEFLNVGSNPKFRPIASYFRFDGDGMIHGLNIKDGKATYVARYVKTCRFQQEENIGASKFVKIGDMKGLQGLLYILLQKLRAIFGVLDLSNGWGTANTALIYHNKKLLALSEGDKPYVIKVMEDGDLETLGRDDYGGRLTHPFTSHPKVDPVTGEMFAFGYEAEKAAIPTFGKTPHFIYRVVSKEGVMHDAVPITIPQCVMMHDFAITEHYAIFMDLPLVFDLKGMVTAGNFVFKFDEKNETRLGVLPRYATNESQLRWLSIPPCYVFHNGNAWEDGDEIVLISCRLESAHLGSVIDNYKRENIEESQQYLYEFSMNLKTGQVKQRQLSALSTEFPRINEEYTGRTTQFLYGGVLKEEKVVGVAKYDLTMEPKLVSKKLEAGGNIAGLFIHGIGRYGGEAIFVPKRPGMEGPEDDGYLICFVHDENTGKSEVVIIDAKTMAPEPVAVVSLPGRVPYGFHSQFVTEEQLRNQSHACVSYNIQ